MPAFVLHVSLPERTDLDWSVPHATEGQSAHYLYDISLPERKRLRSGAKVFLWGTKGSGKHGVFALGTCEKPDDISLKNDKEFDAFALIRHLRVLDRPILPEELSRSSESLSALVNKVESSSLLKFFGLNPAEEDALDRVLLARAQSK